MKLKTDIYWPVFFVVAVVATVATWRFAPDVPLSSDVRAQCILWTHRARQLVRLEPTPQQYVGDKDEDDVAFRPFVAEQPSPSRTECANTSPPASQPKPIGELTAKMRPAIAPAQNEVEDVKAKYADLTKRIEARRREILTRNLSKSQEGKDALAALKAFKEFSAKVDALKKKHGETDYRVTSLRGDLVRLKDEVRRKNDLYKQWKENHPEEILIPEDDPLYRKLTAERALLSMDD